MIKKKLRKRVRVESISTEYIRLYKLIESSDSLLNTRTSDLIL